MKVKNLLLMAVLLLVQWPSLALAADVDGIEFCGTRFPFWWLTNGPRGPHEVRDIAVEQYGADFLVSLSVVNTSRVSTAAGTPFVLTQAVVEPSASWDPSAPVPPQNAQALLDTQEVLRAELPALAPGQSLRLRGIARGFRTGASHVLSASFYDGDIPYCGNGPRPWWLRQLGPRGSRAEDIRILESSVIEVSSRLEGYAAFRVSVSFAYNGRLPVPAGQTVRLVHGKGSAVGYWNPEDPDHDPNDPGNPYAIYFRELLSEHTLERDMVAGMVMTIEGIAHVPQGSVGNVEMVTLAVGQ
jgi:hypothetical protein